MKRYKAVRGKRSKLEYDFLVYDNEKIVFRGSFTSGGNRNLTTDEREIIRAMTIAIKALNYEQ